MFISSRRGIQGPWERPFRSSPREFFVFDALGQHGVLAEPALLVLLVIGEIALEPFAMAVALEGQDVRRDAIQEEAVVADDDRAAGEILERCLERRQC